VLSFALAVIGCGNKNPPKPGELVTFDTVCMAKSKRVTLEGYIGSPTVVSCGHTSCNLDLKRTTGNKPEDATPTSRTPGSSPPTFIIVSFSVGDDRNEMAKPPPRFEPSDIKLRASDGRVVGGSAKVRVTGELSCGANDNELSCEGEKSCSINNA